MYLLYYSTEDIDNVMVVVRDIEPETLRKAEKEVEDVAACRVHFLEHYEIKDHPHQWRLDEYRPFIG